MNHETLHGTKVKIWRDSRLKKRFAVWFIDCRTSNNLLSKVLNEYFFIRFNVSNISYTIENANNKIYYVMSINCIYFLYSVETLNIEEGWSAVHRILSESCRYVNCITWYEVHVPLFIWWTDPINSSLRWWFLKYFIIWCLRM